MRQHAQDETDPVIEKQSGGSLLKHSHVLAAIMILLEQADSPVLHRHGIFGWNRRLSVLEFPVVANANCARPGADRPLMGLLA
ncbi:hypothetical protein D9M68_343320 [compost metagenome]